MTTGLPLRDLECSGDVNCSIDPVCAAVDAIQGHLRAFATSRITPKQAGLVKLRKHNVKVNQDAKPGAALESSLLAYQTYHPPASDVQRSRHHPLQIQLVLSCLHLPSTKGHGAANTSTSWTKIPAKDEPVCEDKGKAKLELPGFDNMTSEELQHEFLTRLSESRDIEANIVNMLKKKHEIKAESSMQSTVEELEKVKAAFDKERAAFETQKSVLKDN
ncbi:uncharacterized protein [Triticum aestivum]|uniref:uncharacterized protein isoform X2 n=1 Tax=Triticum aestivum TaxID=4565 RepID=UPI001D00ACB7|nr:uncharacterized protein LOC123049212 isoform X2 [Triticum aestivum]